MKLPGLAIIAAALSLAAHAENKKPEAAFKDSFALSAERAEGNPLGAAPGGKDWKVAGDPAGTLVFKAGGGITPDADGRFTAIIPLPESAGDAIIRLEAEIDPQQAKFVGLALLPAANAAEFWSSLRLLAMLMANGNIAVYSDAMANQVFVSSAEKYSFAPGEPVRLELEYDPAVMTVTLLANGTPLAADLPLPPGDRPVGFAAIRFENAIAGAPLVKNFSLSIIPRK